MSFHPCSRCGQPCGDKGERCYECYHRERYTREYLLERFWKHVRRGGPDECWPWTGSVGPGGYGRFFLNGRHLRASRASLILAGTEVPPDMHVAHHCDNPPCVNPNHLYVATPSQNERDKHARGRGPQRDSAGRFASRRAA